jgi:glycosyltransferase involved in cell wall biosynthesis
MSLRIWYVSKYVALPSSGTAGGRAYLLMKELALLGNQVAIITSDSNQLAPPPHLVTDYSFHNVDDIQLCWVRTINYWKSKSVRRILSWLHFEWRLLWLPKKKLLRPDVVVVSSLSLLTVLNGLRWRWYYNCRLVFEVRDIWPLTIIEEGGFTRWNPFVWVLSIIERLGYKHADIIVGTMPNLGEHVRQVLGYPKTTYCIPMGVDPATFTAPEPLPTHYANTYFPKGKFVVAHVGSIGISNALGTFLDCAEVMETHEQIHFLVVGDGDLRDYYRKKYAHLKNLTFGPPVPKPMVQSVLAQCDLLYFSVHVSKVWQYGQSLNKVIDYMMAGKPIVASYTGYPSMINEANCGTYIPAGDVSALKQEVKRYAGMDIEERQEIGARGKAWLYENRNYRELGEKYFRIINNNLEHIDYALNKNSIRQVWIVNHYAEGPDAPGGTRHFHFASNLSNHGWQATLIAASVEHRTGRQRLLAGEAKRLEMVTHVPFLWVKTPKYSDNGARRVLNMLCFTLRTLLPKTTSVLSTPDAVIGSSVHPFAALAGALLARRFGVPFIFEVRDLWPQTLIAFGRLKSTGLIAWSFRNLELWLYKRAARVVVLLPNAWEYIVPLGIDRRKLVYVPNGVDLSLFSEPANTMASDFFTLMYFGAHGQANGLDSILQAMKFVQHSPNGRKIILRMVGDGPHKAALIARAKELGLKNTRFESSIPKSHIPALAVQADAFILSVRDLPNLYRYGISMNKIFEYLATSRPVIIASNAINNPVVDAQAGLSVPAEQPEALAQAILRLAAIPPEDRYRMGRAGRDYVEKNHSFAQLSARLASVLDEVCIVE